MTVQTLNYDDLWIKSGMLFNQLEDGTLPKHVLPNTSDNYTDGQERIDTSRYNVFCRTRYFLRLMSVGDDD